MLSLFKPFVRKGVIIIDTQKHTMGRISVRIARELVNTKHAHVIQKNPAMIGLRQPGRMAQSDIAKLTNNPLKTIVNIASLFASRGSRIEALNTIMFKIVNDRLCIAATNLESYFQGYGEPGRNCTFTHDEGTDAVCINADHAKKILSTHGEIAHIHIKGGETPGIQVGNFYIDGTIPDEQFPDIRPEGKGGKSYAYTIANIAQKLNFVGKAVAVNKYKSVLCGVYFDPKKQQLLGSDGSRLHIVSMADNQEKKDFENNPPGVIVPAKLLRIARFITGQVKIVEGNDAVRGINQHVQFDLNIPGCMNCTATYRAIDGNYPNYSDVIPKGFASRFIVKTKDLLSILSKAQVALTSRETRTIEVEFKDGQLKVLATHCNKPLYQGILRGSYTGSFYHGLISIDYFIDAVQTMSEDSIEILLQCKNDAAWTIRGQSGYTAIVMPVEMAK